MKKRMIKFPFSQISEMNCEEWFTFSVLNVSTLSVNSLGSCSHNPCTVFVAMGNLLLILGKQGKWRYALVIVESVFRIC